MTRCPSGKVPYRDKLGAKIALASIHGKRAARRQENRAYRCPTCNQWHLTSKGRAA